ncbi:MAG: hypothetical protein WDM76_07470 [Limisphaerales bacterium]
MRDLERTLGRLSSGSGNARDLVALRMALEQIPALKATLGTVGRDSRRTQTFNDELPDLENEIRAREDSRPTDLISDLDSQISESPDLVELISRAIVDEPPLRSKKAHDSRWI